MALHSSVWDQLKNRTASDLIRSLKADGWTEDITAGATRAFRDDAGRRVVIHYHPNKTYRPKLLKALLSEIGWSTDDLKRLKLIK